MFTSLDEASCIHQFDEALEKTKKKNPFRFNDLKIESCTGITSKRYDLAQG